VLTWGKYKGYALDDILETDPQYLVWLHNNSSIFELSADLLDEAEGCNEEKVWRTDTEGNLIF
jgi:hypothetical protein